MLNPERLIKLTRRVAGRTFVSGAILASGLAADVVPNKVKPTEAESICGLDYIGRATVWTDSLTIAIGVRPKNNENTQFQWKLTPFNNDGPGINTYRGDKENFIADKPVYEGFEGPKMSADGPKGHTLILPEMNYMGSWRNSKEPKALDPNKDAGWCPWRSNYLDTKNIGITSASISPSKLGGIVYSEGAPMRVNTRTPLIQWSDTDQRIFYYEVQLSKDPKFGQERAVAPVFHNLVHGGLKPPYRSWQVPKDFPLEAGQTYHLRLRPRVQGDGTPLEWSKVWQFEVASNATLTAEEIG